MSENKTSKIVKETKEIKKEVKEDKVVKKLSEKNLAIIITSAILVAILIATGIVSLVNAIKNDVGFDYLKSDLSNYVEVDGDYKNFKLEVDIAKPRDIDIDVAIISMLCKDKSETPRYDGALVTSDMELGVGDIVKIWYRGYLIGNNGEQINVTGMSNFTGNAPSDLELGSGSFVPGFELNLVGKNTGDADKFEKITSGSVNENYYIYATYKRTEGSSTTKSSFNSVRMDLSSDLDKEYGVGFKEKVLSGVIGTAFDFKATTAEGVEYSYTDFKIDFAIKRDMKPLVIECYFPYDYNTANLRNETAIFEVYVDGVVDYDAPEFNVEYLQGKLDDEDFGLDEEDIADYEGETIVDKYYAYAKETLDELYEEEYKELVKKAIWTEYLKMFKIKKYPGAKVNEVYDAYIQEMKDQFDSTGGQVYNSYTGSYQTYQTLDTYAMAYLGLSSTSAITWQDYIRSQSESVIKEKLIMYYILRTENLFVSDEDFAKLYDATRQEYLDAYVEQYLEYEDKTREDYTDEEYEEFLEARKKEIFSYYGEDHFTENTYYHIVEKNFLEWPEVSTLDERRAYPVDK